MDSETVGTVELMISIDIAAREKIDTGLHVETWNNYTQEQRQAIVDAYWSQVAADNNNGGSWVTTPGAAAI